MKNEIKVVRVDENEFELSDGRIYPHMIDFEDGVPTIEEFQEHYDQWKKIFERENFINDRNKK